MDIGQIVVASPADKLESVPKRKPNPNQSEIIFDKSNKYTGQFKDGLPDGNGSFIIDNDTYQGRMSKGKPEKFGEYVSKDGWKYKGSFRIGVFHGRGTFISKDEKYEYKGSWKNGTRNMYGEEKIMFENKVYNRKTYYNDGELKSVVMKGKVVE